MIVYGAPDVKVPRKAGRCPVCERTVPLRRNHHVVVRHQNLDARFCEGGRKAAPVEGTVRDWSHAPEVAALPTQRPPPPPEPSLIFPPPPPRPLPKTEAGGVDWTKVDDIWTRP